MLLNNIRFRGFGTLGNNTTLDDLLNALSPYMSYIYPSLYATLKEALRNVDIVQVEQPFLFVPTLKVMKILGKRPIIILDEHNVEFMTIRSKMKYLSANSLLTALSLPYVFLTEKIATRKANLVLCVSEADKKLISKFYNISKDKLTVIPNGVNLSKIEKTPPVNCTLVKNNRIVFFHGTLSWYPNLEAANLIVDYLAPKIPEATFLIAGASPPLTLIKKIEKTKNVKYLGYVENLEGWIKASDVCVAPILRGGGTRLKVLEYAAAGKPIVATFKAVEGLGMLNNVHGLFYRNVSEEFVDGIRRLLKCDQLAQKLGSNAREIAKKYDWTVIGKKLYDIYSELLTDSHGKYDGGTISS